MALHCLASDEDLRCLTLLIGLVMAAERLN